MATLVPFNYMGSLPVLQRSVPDICKTVFDLLVDNEETINDLSMPPSNKLNHCFADTMRVINFRFHLVPDNIDVPVSFCTPVLEDGPFYVIIDVFFSNFEITSAPEMVESRILHEATHAIRHVLIQLCDQVGVSPELLKTPTPNKAPSSMHYEDARSDIPLYKLDQPAFHSGYYVEHRLLGGVWVLLTGYILNDGVPVKLAPEGMPFKVVHKEGDVTVMTGPRQVNCTFQLLSGFDQTGTSRKIFHYGKRVTRTDEETT